MKCYLSQNTWELPTYDDAAMCTFTIRICVLKASLNIQSANTIVQLPKEITYAECKFLKENDMSHEFKMRILRKLSFGAYIDCV